MDTSKGFNINTFNTTFDENRLETATDSGYGNFLKNSKDVEQKNIFANKNFTSDKFNKQFEKQVSKNEINKFIMKYIEPEALQTSKNMAFTELGVDSIDDFSSDNTSRKNLNYMDLKIAHTTSRIVDPKTVENRKQYNDVDELEADRSQISYNLTDNEKKHYEHKKKNEELSEKRRLENLLKYDNITAQQFERIHKLLLGKK